ncbi:MAG TPA: diadenylate cyclase CdaA [Bryobacteraceae bacterium]|jgi:diadenylate cyclase|nr:diadenylate cyclase CdaA [Bryobacteraceae bacterium]
MPAALAFPIPTLTVSAVIDIVAVAFIIYQLLEIVRGTRAAHILIGILAVFVAYEIALRTGLEALRSLLASLAPYSAIAIIVLFQSEIRRTLARLGRKRLFGGYRRPESTAEILLAIGTMSRNHVGALIVMERDIGLRTFIESGVRLDAAISRDLLLSIFMPGTALHDGSVIIQKDRLAAAACFLPLSVNPAFTSNTGTRHRAGIGITEETDCLALIVSEETGSISVAAFGDMESGLSIERVDERIQQHFGAQRHRTLSGRKTAAQPLAHRPTGAAPEDAERNRRAKVKRR